MSELQSFIDAYFHTINNESRRTAGW